MHHFILRLSALFILAGISYQSLGLEFEKTKLVVWKRGETIAGEDFVAANEGVADFITTLPRPTEPLKGLRFECMLKSRWIQPTVRQLGGGSQPFTSYVNIHTVYEIKSCTPID